MRINIKATHIELTVEIRERVDMICEKIEKIINIPDVDALKCDIEIGKITEHHRQGNIFRAEINLTIIGDYLRAVGQGETIFSALDEAYDEIKREIVHFKDKQQSKARRAKWPKMLWWRRKR